MSLIPTWLLVDEVEELYTRHDATLKLEGMRNKLRGVLGDDQAWESQDFLGTCPRRHSDFVPEWYAAPLLYQMHVEWC